MVIALPLEPKLCTVEQGPLKRSFIQFDRGTICLNCRTLSMPILMMFPCSLLAFVCKQQRLWLEYCLTQHLLGPNYLYQLRELSVRN